MGDRAYAQIVCSAKDVTAFEELGFGEEEYWKSLPEGVACDKCHVLMETDDRRGLAQRSLDELILKHPEASAAAAVLYEQLVELHQQFFAHRSGTAVPIPANAA